MDTYILKDKEPVECHDLMEWANWFETANRHVAKTEISGKTPPVSVSTVFLGMDHSFFGEKPLLFETMIFGGEHDGYQERYSTWEDAESGHARAVEIAKGTDAV